MPDNAQVSNVRQILVLPDRDAALEAAEEAADRFGLAEEPDVVREALAGEDDAEDAQWLVVIEDGDGLELEERHALRRVAGLSTELADVTAPTLVLCGSQDVLTTQGDSEEIASLIPGAELAVVRGGAHLFMVEQAGAFNRTVGTFLERVTSPGRFLEPVGAER